MKSAPAPKRPSPSPGTKIGASPAPSSSNEPELLARRCPAAGWLIRRAQSDAPLTANQMHVLIHIFAPLGTKGALYLHRMLRDRDTYHPDELNRRLHAVSPQPMGCETVRRKLSPDHPREACCCVFSLPEGGYPAPLVHLDRIPKVAGRMRKNPGAPDVDGDGRIHGDLSRRTRARAEWRRLKKGKDRRGREK